MRITAHANLVVAAALSLAVAGVSALPCTPASAAVRMQAGASASTASDADGAQDKVADGAKAAEQKIVDVSTLTPVTAADLEDGTYRIDVESSSSMFRIVKAVLTVDDGTMSCTLTMSGKGYGKLYMGTAEDAAQASEDDCIPYVEDEQGAKTFTVPLESLNTEVDCAAWSIKKEAWYARTLVFMADTLRPADQELADGAYTLDVALEGGSGRASVETPCTLEVEGGAMTATVVWSSPNYDQMVVDGTQYLPVNTEGNSTFKIPVATLSEPLAVQAETTAMSTPHMIDYTLTFDASTAQKK